MTTNPITRTRARVGEALFARVAGKDGHAARERVHGTPGPRWFPQGSAIRRVHGDASMWVGGLRALLLQSLHPLAMAGVAGHSGYRGDPWGRLERTSTFLATTTFGAADDAQAMVDRIRAVHDRVRGKAPDGRPYNASDPHLLLWVHVAEADSFLTAHQRYGAEPLSAQRADEYVAQTARVAVALGATGVPTTVADLAECLESYRPELVATPAALDTAKFLLHEPPLPAAAKVPFSLMAAGAVALLPEWAREQLELGGGANRTIGPIGAALATRAIRWGLSASLPDYPTL
ncbi:oxygenase MpaB family protein [Demequina sp.]|uniref:oxygenase MpaB family protein n=1 Tax=Demequina sp. TaxID=2050685 RepID=UPI0025C5E569|nr:oxygenase MpaB family protein [Demequina sp.]